MDLARPIAVPWRDICKKYLITKFFIIIIIIIIIIINSVVSPFYVSRVEPACHKGVSLPYVPGHADHLLSPGESSPLPCTTNLD